MPSERTTFPFLVGRPASTFYRPCDVLGRGAFGKVRRCHKMATDEPVAVKVLKRSAIKRAMKEVSMLRRLSHLDLDRCNIVKFHEGFRLPRGRPCLVFELLDISLWDYMKARKPLHVQHIRPIVQQVAVALGALKAVGMIHMDLKPDNIMLVNQDQHPFRVKLIDFGAAMNPADAVLGVQQQNIVCRAPEVFLGLPFSEAIDAWSLGCVTARLRLGYWLYPGKGEFDVVTATDVVKSIVHINGRPADHLLSSGVNAARFFKRAPPPGDDWILKTPEEDEKQESIKLRGLPSAMALSSLDDLKVLATRGVSDPLESADTLQWVELLQSMLQTDPQRRTTPDKILAHPFICMSHMARSYGHSSYVQSCVDSMTTAVPGFLKPPFKDSQRAKVPLTTTQLTTTQLTTTQLATAKDSHHAKVAAVTTQLATANDSGGGGLVDTSQRADDRRQARPHGGDT